MINEKAQLTDSIIVELNGVRTDAKGPDPDRLADHAKERRAFANRLRKESESER